MSFSSRLRQYAVRVTFSFLQASPLFLDCNALRVPQRQDCLGSRLQLAATDFGLATLLRVESSGSNTLESHEICFAAWQGITRADMWQYLRTQRRCASLA